MDSQNFRISNPFQVGLLGGLGVLTALVIGGAIATLANVITYVFAAVFLALGLDPVVSFLERRKFPRPLAVLTVILAVLAFVLLAFWTMVPTLITESSRFLQSLPQLIAGITEVNFINKLDGQLGGAITSALDSVSNFVANADNWPTLFGGVVQVGITLFTGAFGLIIIVVLTIFFLASLDGFKNSLYKLVPNSKRLKFIEISNHIAKNVGRYTIGQLSVAALNALLGFAVMSLLGLQFALVVAFVVFILAVIPLIGSLSGAILAVLIALAENPTAALILGIYYLIYMQIEAYIISPRVMKVAVAVPAPIVVIAALSGGALLGVLGALVAVPLAASVIFIIREILVPRQAER